MNWMWQSDRYVSIVKQLGVESEELAWSVANALADERGRAVQVLVEGVGGWRYCGQALPRSAVRVGPVEVVVAEDLWQLDGHGV